jgi:uncharacterized protein (TIGR03118 family)
VQHRHTPAIPSFIVIILIACGVCALAAARHVDNDNSYVVTLLASTIPGEAPITDARLTNAWGIAASASSPWWVSDNGADYSTIYTGAGVKAGLEVAVPGAPTGIVSYPATGTRFVLTGGQSARFIWATESGTVLGWRSGTTAELRYSAPDAIYKGLAIHGDTLYLTDFGHCSIQALDGTFSPFDTTGGFSDDSIPKAYCPFGIQAIGDAIFVTYALRGGLDDIAGVSHGFVNAFDTNGHLTTRVAQHGTLNSPWGLAMAPADFGKFSGCLLVGNFGDGLINAFCDEGKSGFHPRGRLEDRDGGKIHIEGLWGIGFGNGAASGPVNVLYFAAGPNDESDGRFGKIAFVEERD